MVFTMPPFVSKREYHALVCTWLTAPAADFNPQ